MFWNFPDDYDTLSGDVRTASWPWGGISSIGLTMCELMAA